MRISYWSSDVCSSDLWELPEDRPQLRAQPQHARRHEVRQRRLDVLQAAHMGDVARSLDRAHEAGRGLVAPAGEAVGLQEAIDGAVDLYRREAPGGKGIGRASCRGREGQDE